MLDSMLRLVITAEATLGRAIAPTRPAIIPIRYFRIAIPGPFSLLWLGHLGDAFEEPRPLRW